MSANGAVAMLVYVTPTVSVPGLLYTSLLDNLSIARVNHGSYW